MPYRQHIGSLIKDALQTIDVEVSVSELEKSVEVPRDQSHGDFAFPCFRFAKVLRKSPVMIAQELAEKANGLLENYPDISGVKQVGPYLNFKINKTALAASLIPGILSGEFLDNRPAKNEKVMIEYSQPNTHKAFHVGHTRNAALGDALVRMFEWNGYEVVAANYIGDEGAHIAKCLWYYQQVFNGDIPDQNLGEFLGELYTQATILLDFKQLSEVPILGLKTARVLEKKQHPSQENWQIVQVDLDDHKVQVICGGKHYEPGDIVAYAGPGSKIAGRVITTTQKEGVASEGMICSPKELGLGDDGESIYRFESGTPVGLDVAEYFRKDGVQPEGVSVSEIMASRLAGVSETLKKLEAREPQTDKLWQETKAWSMREFHAIYDWLGCRFDHYYFESDVGEKGKDIVLDLLEKKILVKSEGAVGADLSEKGLPFFLLLKSDGTGLYSTKDIALAQNKFDQFQVDRSIYVVDASQSLHFQQVFATLELMGYERAKNCYHLAYGLVVLPEGKMSSRDGNVILFSELKRILDEKIRVEYLERYRGDWSDEEIAEASRRVSVATIRYGMLNQDNAKMIVFNLDEWTARSGNTGPYLLYAYARTRSILREVGEIKPIVQWELLTHETEAALLNRMSKFPEVASRACRDFRPNVICHYLYQLCKDFSRMYDQCSVMRAESEALRATRASLVDAFGLLLKKGLSLLGIETLERM